MINLAKLGVVHAELFRGDTDEETKLMRTDHQKAKEYLLSHGKWCKNVKDGYVAFGVPKVFNVHLFNIDPCAPNVYEWQWVVYGDIPPCYFGLDDIPDCREVIVQYLELLEEWCSRIDENLSVDELPPVKANTPRDFSKILRPRLAFIRERFVED